jgi:hydrogenase maturation protease
MEQNRGKILVYGIGNPGRQDDGLGILFAEKIEEWLQNQGFINVEVTSNYQLNIEDAEKISHYTMLFLPMLLLKPIHHSNMK